jgi:four helix bundle protein
MSTPTYRDLDAWKVAMDLVELVYRLTATFPDSERYGLTSQLRRASVSIPSNVAEGQARGTAKVGLHYLGIAIGSVAEIDTQLEIARRLRFTTADRTRDLEDHVQRVRQMLYGMRREHERRLATPAATALLVVLLFYASAVLR